MAALCTRQLEKGWQAKGVATQLENSGVTENIAARLLGHDLNTMSYGLYSGGVSFDVLSEAIEHLSWK